MKRSVDNNIKGRWFFKKETCKTPFGMTMPGRSYNAHTSRHGFTGHEKENDLAEGIYTTEYRLYDTRVGRWLSVDPLFEKYVGMSPYNYCMLNPVMMVDPDGRRSLPIDEEYNGFNARVDSWFGPRNIKNGSKNHKGLDFNYSCGGNNDYGSPIKATHDGVVTIKDNTSGGEGRMVTITSQDGKFRTRYMHLSSVEIENGTNINEGETLGYMGGSGKGKENKYLSHLHYEIQKFENNEWISINPTSGENKLENIIDPQLWLKKPSVKSVPKPTTRDVSKITPSINKKLEKKVGLIILEICIIL